MLDAETLHFGKGLKERVGPNADWARTATSRPCLTPVNITKWVVVFVDKAKAVAQQFCK